MLRRVHLLVSLGVLCASTLPASTIGGYQQTNLVSDIPGMAAHTDPNLVNPWGISFSGGSPFWISDNGTGLATLYNGSGTPQSLVVTIPKPGGGVSAPTGQVFNSSGQFNGDNFIFASEDGTVTGWRGALGTTAETLLNNSSSGAVFKGIAIATTAQGTYLYTTDFHNDKVTVIPSTGAPALSGNFVDPNIPAGYAPFNIENIGGKLYVTYAKQDAAGHDDVAGPGNGYISVFDLNGNFLERFASNGPLDSPWGLTVAPSTFGPAAGDLLVGNFGNGAIDAYNLNGTLVGTLADASGNALINSGLWALTFGNGGNGGSVNTLYLTAGLNGEQDGLFASIAPVPEPATWSLLAGGLGLLALRRRLRQGSR